MQYTIFTVLATAATLASAQSGSVSSAVATSSQSPIGAVVPVGGDCVPGGTMCALGSNCYAVNSMLQPRCGNFQASCTSNQQCAFNTCNQGFCNGLLPSSAASSTPAITSTPTGGFTPAPSSTVTAAPGSLPLGAQCNALVKPSQCAGDAQCWASNSGLIARCGNFNAACSSNSQCAFNTCNNGLCNGFLASSSAGNSTMTVSSMASGSASSGSATRSATGTGSVTRSATGNASRTSSMPQFTGAAAVATMVPEVMAVMLGVAAWAL